MAITLPSITGDSISSYMTAASIIDQAAKELGYIGAGENLTGEEYEDILPRLNFMLKSWQADGVNLWRETGGTVIFPANIATVPLIPYVIDVIDARVVQSSTFERPLQRWGSGEYNAIPNKAARGFPTAFYLDKAANAAGLTVWPVPMQDTVVNYTYARVIGDVTDVTSIIDVPQQWTETVWVNLAARCATMFGSTRLDPAAVAMVTQKADALYQKMLDSDRPASIIMSSIYTRY